MGTYFDHRNYAELNKQNPATVAVVVVCFYLFQSLAEMDAQTAALEKEHEAVSGVIVITS